MNNEGKSNKKKTIKKVIIGCVIAFVVFILVCMAPYLYFCGTLLWEAFFNKPDQPIVEHGEFPFELTYEYKGETVTIKDTIVCDYMGYSFSLEGGNSNDWDCTHINNEENGSNYVIDIINDRELMIVVPDGADYYMGDETASEEFVQPYVHFVDDATGTYYEGTTSIESVGIEIIDWKLSEPLKDNFK